jgi:hypothetical protein
MTPQLSLRRFQPTAADRARRVSGSADPISRAILASAERARRLADTVPLSNGAVATEPPQARGKVAAWLGGLSLWTIMLFLLGLE